MSIKTIGVIGAGQMGSGIAYVAALNRFRVILNDLQPELVQKGAQTISTQLTRRVEKDELTIEQKEQTLENIQMSTALTDMEGADFVIEAAPENMEVKTQIFAELERICRAEVIVASNTSSFSITRIAAQTRRGDRIIGMHFMNPVPVMELVEIISGLNTSETTVQTTWDLALQLNKTPVKALDSPGFIANRILLPMINEAAFCLYEGIGTAEAIDTVMHLGMNHPMGPLALADLIGLDTCLSILETLYEGFKDPKYRPCPLLVKYVEAGWLGRKTNRGFYTYDR